MSSPVEKFIIQIESFNPEGLGRAMANNEQAKSLKDEMAALLKQLKIALKAGLFDDFAQREAPLLIEKIKAKKEELLVFVEDEKNKEKVAKELALLKTARRDFRILKARQLVQEQKASAGKLTTGEGNWTGPIEKNKVWVGIAGTILIFQILFNVFYVSRIKSSYQFAVVEPLQKRTVRAETENQELLQKVTNLKRQVQFLQNVNMKLPDLYSPPSAKSQNNLKLPQDPNIQLKLRKPASNVQR